MTTRGGGGARPPPPPRAILTPPLPPRRVGSFEEPVRLAENGFDPLEIVDREVVATLLPGLDAVAAQALAGDNALVVLDSSVLGVLEGLVVRLRIDDGRTVAAVVAALSADARVAAVGPNRIFRSQAGSPHCALARLGLSDAAADAPTGAGVTVAVIDTRPDLDHPEFAGVEIRVESLLDGDEDIVLDHGTQIAGLIAGAGRLRGAAAGAKIVAIAAFSADAEGRSISITYRLLQALELAQDAGARVVNMSFAGGEDALLAQGLDVLAEAGAILVAAAGNAGPESPPAFPGSHPDVIAVTATDAEDALYRSANRGDYVLLSAPGVDLMTPAAYGRYALGSGTSLAAAYVSAAAALAIERDPNASADEIRAALTGNAIDLGPPGKDEQFGYGLIAPSATLDALAPGPRAVMR